MAATETTGSEVDWTTLVPELLVEIFSYLSLEERFCIYNVCSGWRKILGNSRIWQSVRIKFDEKFIALLELKTYDSAFLRFLCCICHKITNFVLSVDQTHPKCTDFALKILKRLALSDTRRLRNVTLIFINENPLFYSGKEFIDVLHELFNAPRGDMNSLEYLNSVDLSRFPVCLDNKLVSCLVDNHCNNLTDIKLQNYSLVCNISKNCVHNLAKKCKNLKSFSIHMSAFDGETLKIFCEPGRQPIQFLSLFCQREDKYTSDIESDDWEKVCKACPELRVKFYFDHTCPIFRVQEILKPVIPVKILKLRLLATVTDLVYFVGNNYSKTIEVFDVTTTSSSDLDAAILFLSMNCEKLKELHVWCRLSKSVVDQILLLLKLEKHTLAFNTACEQ